jgi:hypothetical protein
MCSIIDLVDDEWTIVIYIVSWIRNMQFFIHMIWHFVEFP